MAATSIFEIFKIGVGPSSSHTVGPMRAAREFALNVQSGFGLESVGRVAVNLYGSLALTGRGHASDTAILLGLSGEEPERTDPEMIPERTNEIRETGRLRLLDEHEIPFNADTDLVFLFSDDAGCPDQSSGVCNALAVPVHPLGHRLLAGGP